MGWLQATFRARVIIDAIEAMVSISSYPDLTRLGISERAADHHTVDKFVGTVGEAGAGPGRGRGHD
jgi:hypothetical protein